MGRRISKEFLHPSILEGVNDKIGNLDELETNAKGNMVQAVNELIDNLNKTPELEAEMAEGKELIANAIGEPLSAGETFQDMSTDINGLLSTFKTNMMNNGIVVDDNDNFNSLICKIATDVTGIKRLIVGKNIESDRAWYYILKNDGTLWSCGHNNYGQLGLGDTDNRKTFVQVTTNISVGDIKQIDCGPNFILLVKNDGSLWACGRNYYGQLGLVDYGSTVTYKTFTQVTTNINNDVKQVACGSMHTMILKNDGTLWACGINSEGQTAIPNNTNVTGVYTQVNTDVREVCCGLESTIIIKNDGSIWGTGKINPSLSSTSFTQLL